MIGLGEAPKDGTVIEVPPPTYDRDTPPMYVRENESVV